MNTNGHYQAIETGPHFDRMIGLLQCAHCPFSVSRRSVGQPRSSKSGLGRYNRMEGAAQELKKL